MSNPYDQQAITAVLNTAGSLTAAELAKTLHWSRIRVRTALAALEQAGTVQHNADRSWEPTQ
nr:MAG TPA: EAP30/Vps36 family protein [Caudoviricetes sp.]